MGFGFLSFPGKGFINEKCIFILCVHKCAVPVRSAIVVRNGDQPRMIENLDLVTMYKGQGSGIRVGL